MWTTTHVVTKTHVVVGNVVVGDQWHKSFDARKIPLHSLRQAHSQQDAHQADSARISARATYPNLVEGGRRRGGGAGAMEFEARSFQTQNRSFVLSRRQCYAVVVVVGARSRHLPGSRRRRGVICAREGGEWESAQGRAENGNLRKGGRRMGICAREGGERESAQGSAEKGNLRKGGRR